MRAPRMSRRWIVTSIVAVAVSVLIVVGLLVVYPRVGASVIRDRLGERVATRLGRDLRIGSIKVSLGQAVLRDVEIRGALDGDTPLVHVDRIDVEFDAWRSLIGSIRLGAVKVDGVLVTVRRGADGTDNIADVLARLGAERPSSGDGGGAGSGRTPTEIRVTRIRLLADDATTSSTALVADGDATWVRGGPLTAELRGLAATSIAAPKAAAAKLKITRAPGAKPVVAVEGGEVALYPRLALSGIDGTVRPDEARAGQYVIELTGGYGGVPGTLWTAKGGLDPGALTASLELEAAKFQLERLAPILARSPVVDYANTSVDTKVKLAAGPRGATFSGEFHLYGLNVGHPMIAGKEVHGVDLSGTIEGSFDRDSRQLQLVRGDFVARDVPFSVTGSAVGPRRAGLEAAAIAASAAIEVSGTGGATAKEAVKKVARRGPGGLQELKLRLVIPQIACQKVLDAIPKEMAPSMAGYQLRGMFDTDVQLAIDWTDLDATVLDGHVGIRQCRVTKEPKDSPKRLEEEFEHFVEYEKDKWLSFMVGDSNEDFVPLHDISPYLIGSILSTEDTIFFQHKGFIPSEFRTALVNDLKAGKFTHGASSITMQMVKNVLLYREKTLARKLQELFLTWHVENTLEKERILEIYLNVIEYGPALYGIGPAAKHYFGKSPHDLNPVESAFFSSILPSPKERYKQYCAGTLTRFTEEKIKLYLAVMLKRKRLTEAEYETALATPLLFVKDGDETEEECLKRTQKAIKNTRSTNPMKQDPNAPTAKPTKKRQVERKEPRRDKGDRRIPI